MAVPLLLTSQSMCTSTLITDRVVLTAAHCVDDFDYDSVSVYFGISGPAGIRRSVSEVLVHPGYSSDRLINDIALVRLEDRAPEGIEPIPHLPPSLEVTTADLGTDLLFVGFGETETGSAGRKMWMTAPLTHVCTRSGGCWPGQRYTLCIDQWPTGICSGDSGGPAFIERAGQLYVAGVNSYTFENCVEYGCSTKVDEFETFINDFIGSADGTPCATNGDCSSSFCVDGFCCAERCAGTCQVCNQAGQEGACLPLADGTACPDPNMCNGQEICLNGLCQAADPLDCADEVDCTKDLCDPGTGCVNQPSALRCFDDNTCTDDLCDAQLGCVNSVKEDGFVCDLDAVCKSGVCQALPKGDDCACATGLSRESGLLLLFVVVGLFGIRRRRE